MLQTTSCFLVALLSAVNGQQQRQVLYSRLVDEVTDYSLAVVYGKGVRFSKCAEICCEDDFCAEFLYSETNGQCIGLHYAKKGSYSYQNIVPATPKMLRFKREFNWIEYAGQLYFYGGKDAKVGWKDAKLVCQKMGAHLVEIENTDESFWLAAEFLMTDNLNCENDYRCSAWTGLNDIDIEGKYVWDYSNASALFTNWYPREPSLYTDTDALTRDCIDMLQTGEWNDRPCSHLTSFICEKNMLDP